MSKEDRLREVLDDTVDEIAQIQGNPRTWLSWIVYLLARLEERATDASSANKDSYLEMLSALQDDIRTRMKTGGWH